MNSKTVLKGRLLYSGEDGGAVVIYDTLEGRLSIDDNSGAVRHRQKYGNGCEGIGNDDAL